MNEKLKKCPFCGGETNNQREWTDPAGWKVRIICLVCDISTPWEQTYTGDERVFDDKQLKAWNTRPPRQSTDDFLKRFRERFGVADFSGKELFCRVPRAEDVLDWLRENLPAGEGLDAEKIFMMLITSEIINKSSEISVRSLAVSIAAHLTPKSVPPKECPHKYFEKMGRPDQQIKCDLFAPKIVKWPEELKKSEKLNQLGAPKSFDDGRVYGANKMRAACIKAHAEAERGVDVERKKIVCLCGSTRFVDVFAVTAWLLERDEDVITLGLHLLPHWYASKEEIPDHLAEHEGVKEQMDNLHMRKIDLADEVFVINIDDYIGNSTRREIEYAQKLKLPIRWYTHEDVGKKVETIIAQAAAERFKD